MRRAKAGLALILCMVMVMGTRLTNAAGDVTISSFSATISTEKVVKIEGYMNAGSGNPIGVKILSTDRDNYPYTYLNSIYTEDNGHFSISYTMSDAKAGVKYDVLVRATNTATNEYAVKTASFEYKGKVAVTGVSLNKSTAGIMVGADEILTATVVPADATNKDVAWTSSDSTVAKVDAAGKVTGVKTGTATITVKTLDGNKTANCVVTVTSGTFSGPSSGTSTIKAEDTAKLTLEGNTVRVSMTQTFDKDSKSANIKLDSTTLTNAFSKAIENADGTKLVEVDMSQTTGASIYEATIPVKFLRTMSGGQILKINSGIASITISGDFLYIVQGFSEASNVSIVFGEVNKSSLSEDMNRILGDRKVVEINIKVDGVSIPVHSINSTLTISVPYTPTSQDLENPDHISVWCIDGDKEVPYVNARYDAAKGVVIFETSHLSKFAVGAVYKTFDDLSNFMWAKKSIDILYSRGIVDGTSATTFSPARNITRAEFVTLLVKTLGLSAEGTNTFEDVKASDYYYDAVCTAKKLGITNGVTDKLFCPNAAISRQDMMVMTNCAMIAAGKIDSESSNFSALSRFKDSSNISKYAVNSISTLVNQGIVSGSGDKMNPRSYTTRAEAAALLYKVYSK